MITWTPVLLLLGCGQSVSNRSATPVPQPAAPVPVQEAPVPEPDEPAPPTFAWRSEEIPESLRAEMIGTSYREGCPTPMEELRLLHLVHWDFEGRAVEGRLVVHHSAVEVIHRAFRAAFDEGFRVRRMEPVSAFEGSDDASMAADNTSAFNCRTIKGTRTWSEHSSGLAIDVNPRENPWVRGDEVDPPEGAAFLERDGSVPGLLTEDSAMVQSFLESGWGWGGRWGSRKDYQHFSASGR